jgi:hypothetical protein
LSDFKVSLHSFSSSPKNPSESVNDNDADKGEKADELNLHLCHFEFTVDNGGVGVKGNIVIKINYPTQAPLFKLTLCNSDEDNKDLLESLEKIEKELNESTLSNISLAGEKPHVLTIQMRKLFAQLDPLISEIDVGNADQNELNAGKSPDLMETSMEGVQLFVDVEKALYSELEEGERPMSA